MGCIRLALLFSIVLVILIEPGEGCVKKLKALKGAFKRVGKVFKIARRPKAAKVIANSADDVGKVAKKSKSFSTARSLLIGGTVGGAALGGAVYVGEKEKKKGMSSGSYVTH
ncbi:hypothetical protein BOX15_Mlig005534g3 [Macrostomum lignano]|uniref:Uncharacterized protein n=1 Tax=Macrostomum lignano TaxID=282301 RepID=A0A267G900_9PLAT|nr:hypothetical protein BOX15_Mlig005534g2 [Macrostomum lignano]PAA82525.1 hypothetical protein BOX15_Mlig005534g3 [Macrostomum lignano]